MQSCRMYFVSCSPLRKSCGYPEGVNTEEGSCYIGRVMDMTLIEKRKLYVQTHTLMLYEQGGEVALTGSQIYIKR